MTDLLTHSTKDKIWVYWEITSLNYKGLGNFAEKSGITTSIEDIILVDKNSFFQKSKMSGVGELVAIYLVSSGGWTFFNKEYTNVTFDAAPKEIKESHCIVKCRNNRFILVNLGDFIYFKDADEELWWADYEDAYYCEFVDDTTPSPIFQTQDYVYWEADAGDAVIPWTGYSEAYQEENEVTGQFDTCKGQVIERFYYGHIYSHRWLNNAIEIYCEDNDDLHIDYVSVDYEGWVYAIATKVNGVNYMLWTPEENLTELCLYDIYNPYLDVDLTFEDDDYLCVSVSHLNEINQTMGKNIDMLLMPILYEDDYLEFEEYEQIPF